MYVLKHVYEIPGAFSKYIEHLNYCSMSEVNIEVYTDIDKIRIADLILNIQNE